MSKYEKVGKWLKIVVNLIFLVIVLVSFWMNHFSYYLVTVMNLFSYSSF